MTTPTDFKRFALDHLVFFASPFAAPDAEGIARNVKFAEDSCRDLATRAGVSSYAPHLYFPRFLRDEVEEERWLGIGGGAVVLKRSDEIALRLPPWRTSTDLSTGMKAEHGLAVGWNKPRTIIYTDRQWDEYLYHLRQRVISVPLLRVG